MRLSRTVVWIALCLLGAACGGAPPPDLHAAFGRIQVHEAVIARSELALAECTAAGEAPCPGAEASCAAAESICVIAAEVDDDDARARCELARRRCPEGAPR